LSKEPLNGAGTNAWQALYNAAKNYSVNYAYSDKDFPNIEDDSLCVLCMQPIKDPEVKLRFKRFKKFMEDTSKKSFEDAKTKLKKMAQVIDQIQFYDDDDYNDIYDIISEYDSNLTIEIQNYLRRLRSRKTHFQKCIDDLKYISPRPFSDFPKQKLRNIYIELDKSATKLEESSDPDKLLAIRKKYNELNSRRLLNNNKIDLLIYLKLIETESRYNTCIRSIKTRNITIIGRDIISESLTPQLETALEEELLQLGGKRFPVFYKVTGDKGATEHQLHLKGTVPLLNVQLGEILSEGEQCVIALAGFFAELKTSNSINPIVLDDPVCSLDHKFRRRIARRLVIESKSRQVIIFTHDLSFLLMLQEFAESFNCEMHIKSIERTLSTPGCNQKLTMYSFR
jgi:hypothetical protein